VRGDLAGRGGGGCGRGCVIFARACVCGLSGVRDCAVSDCNGYAYVCVCVCVNDL
jgi:hypothetical protein